MISGKTYILQSIGFKGQVHLNTPERELDDTPTFDVTETSLGLDNLLTTIDGASDYRGRWLAFASIIGARLFIFEKIDGEWVENRVIETEYDENALYGKSVAISGNRIAVGAPGLKSVFVYEYKNDAWDQTPNPFPLVSDQDDFGTSLAFDNELLLVGCPTANLGSGAIYPFFYKNFERKWIAQSAITVPSPAPGTVIGNSISISENMLVAGSPTDTVNSGSSMANAGAVYVWIRTGSEGQSWSYATRLVSSDPGSNYRFGTSVYASAGQLLVGEPGFNSAMGRIQLFSGTPDSWTLDQAFDLVAIDPSAEVGDEFGTHVAYMNSHKVIVGYSANNLGNGAMYVWQRTEAGNIHQAISFKLLDEFASPGASQISVYDGVIVIRTEGSLVQIWG